MYTTGMSPNCFAIDYECFYRTLRSYWALVQPLNFDPNAQAWGINFQRTIRRKDEEIRWNSFARNRQLNTMTEAALEGSVHT